MKLALSLGLIALSMPLAMHAESKRIADYPLRLHIFSKNSENFYYRRQLEDSQGEGRANLFADGEVHAVEFNYQCGQKFKASFGYETYPAKWKKPNRELTVLFPVFGQAGSYFTCTLKTDVKDYAYRRHQGQLSAEPPSEFKAWMEKHDYDPEHGKDVPVGLAAGQQSPEQP